MGKRPKGGLPSWATSNTAVGYCETHGKQLYMTRAAAKGGIRVRHGRESGMSAYRCDEHEGHWHIGHLRPSVRRGDDQEGDYA